MLKHSSCVCISSVKVYVLFCWQEEEVRQKYMAKMEGQVTSARTGWQSHRKIVTGLEKQVSIIC